MEISGHHQEEEDIPMPINSSFNGVQHAHSHHSLMTHHHHPHHYDPSSSTSHNQQNNIIPSNNSNGNTSTTTNVTNMDDDHHQVQCNINGNGNGNKNDDGDDVHDMGTKKKSMMIIKYKECQKNHAASMGGNATDGCGEFMPNGEHGSIESFSCSACKCHRNFHRKEIQGYPTNSGSLIPFARSITMNMHMHDDHHLHHHQGNGIGMMMIKPHPYHHHDDHYHQHDHNQMVKKRFRTKFSQEQKEKMLEFAEKVGWKIQKQEDEVQQFCQEIGIKRRVLKVWMHNNKHTLAKHKTNLNNTN